MQYTIQGLDPSILDHLRGLDEAELAKHNARRVIADAKPGYPCRATLADAEIGESLILFEYVSHDVATPFRTSYAIYVREGAGRAARYDNAEPPFWTTRSQSLRGFDKAGMLRTATLAPVGRISAEIVRLFDDPKIAYIQAYNPAYGCFMAQIERG